MALSCALVALVLNANDAHAQRPWTGRVRGAFNALIQTDSAGLSQSFTLAKNNEPASITAELPPTIAPLFDGGIVVRIAGNLGAGAAFSSLTRTDEAQIAARIPHPFFFNQLRAIEGTSSVEQKEFATHLSAVYMVAFDRLDVALLGGLSLFQLDKDFVVDVVYDESYPYDTATFARSEISRASASKTGFHAGADVTWRLGRRWGIGGLLRYSRASVPFEGRSIDAGGLQAGGGVRVLF